MLKIFISIFLLLILYQFFEQIIEGLETENNDNKCEMSLTDRNISLLNDRVNVLQIQYADLSGNIANINKQMEELMKQNVNEATALVGNTPLNISPDMDTVPDNFI